MGRRHAEARWSPWDLLRAAMGETNTVRFARACPSYTKLAWLTNHTHALQVPARMGRRHAEARWSPWDLLRAAMGETNTVRFARACPSYTKLAWLTNHTQELQGTSRDIERDIERDTATIVVAVVVVVVVVATAAAAPTQPHREKDTHTPSGRHGTCFAQQWVKLTPSALRKRVQAIPRVHASPHCAATETIHPPPLGTGRCGLEDKWH